MILRRLAATFTAFLLLSAAHAASEEGLAAAIIACSVEPDAATQLACYNRIAAQLKTAAQPPAPVTQTSALAAAKPPVAAAAPAPVPAPAAAAGPQVAAQASAAPPAKREGGAWYDVGSWFGSGQAPPPSRPMVGSPADFGKADIPFATDVLEPLDHITAGVASASYNFFGRFTITLDNGQVWRQEDSDTNMVHFHTDKPDVVTIKRGILGGYSLTIENGWGSHAVRRIK